MPNYNSTLQSNNTDLQAILNTINGLSNSLEDLLINREITSCVNTRVDTIGEYAFANCFSLTSVNFPVCTNIGQSAFQSCSSLTSVNFPVCTNIGMGAFRRCSSLTSVNFPTCTVIGHYAFQDCSSLISVNFPVCTSIGFQAFQSCSSLTSVNFPVCTNIHNQAFYDCGKLSKIYLGASTICSLSDSNVFIYTSITSSTGSIFVPSSLVASYKTATNWAFFSNRIYSA